MQLKIIDGEFSRRLNINEEKIWTPLIIWPPSQNLANVDRLFRWHFYIDFEDEGFTSVSLNDVNIFDEALDDYFFATLSNRTLSSFLVHKSLQGHISLIDNIIEYDQNAIESVRKKFDAWKKN